MTKQIMKYITNSGLWAIDEIKVEVIDDHLAWVGYKKYEINAEINRIVVKVGFFERRKGIKLEDKLHKAVTKLKNKLILDNEKIKKRKELESKFN